MVNPVYKPSLCVLELTNCCNLRCPHCASDSGVSRCYEMNRGELQKVFHDLAELGCNTISIQGGEILLRPDWYEVCQDARSAGMDLQLITNGLLVNDEVREKFLSLDPQTVCVSLDGATPETYKKQRGVDGFDKCMALLKQFVDDGFRQINAITTFSSLNIHEFDDFAKLFIDTDIVWQVQMVHKAGSRFDDKLLLNQEQFEFFTERATFYLNEYLGRLKIMTMDDFGYFPITPKLHFIHQIWNGCSAGRRTIGIRSNGDVLGCLSLGDDFIEANLLETPLAEIWNSGKYFQRFRKKEELLCGQCAKCTFGKKCKAGCTAMAISSTNTMGDNTYCVRRLEEKKLLQDLFGG